MIGLYNILAGHEANRRLAREELNSALCAQVIRLRVSYNQNDETHSRNSG